MKEARTQWGRFPEGTVFKTVGDSSSDVLTAEQRKNFQDDLAKAKQRSERFGGPYNPPDVKSYLDSQFVRQMQRSGGVVQGFTTGIDMSSTEEQAKREARQARFNMPTFGTEFSTDSLRAVNSEMTESEWKAKQEEDAKRAQRREKFAMDMDLDADNKFDLYMSKKTRSERMDPDPNAT